MFLHEIERLAPEALSLVRQTGVGSFDELYALTRQFPSLAMDGLHSLPNLSNLAAARASSGAMAAFGAPGTPGAPPIAFAKGAVNPPESAVGNGYQESPLTLAPGSRVAPYPNSISHLSATQVKDQGQRGTCVGHAVVASAESLFAQGDLSEQYCYWAAKVRGTDPFPANEGTWLRCARQGLDQAGLCQEPLWPYVPGLMTNNPTHQVNGFAPSLAAMSDAAPRRRMSSLYLDLSGAKTGKASILARELLAGPVAVTVPVFLDTLTKVDNWNWFGAVHYGHVSDPVQFSIVVGGHAVCMFGYEPSSVAPGGGWFIFKNSWGTALWSDGQSPPVAQHPAWRAGYGYLSAEYVNRYAWELLRV